MNGCLWAIYGMVLTRQTSSILIKSVPASIYILTRQAIFVECNIEARSCSHCFTGKAVSITCSENVFESLGIGHAVPYCHLCPVRLYSIFPHYLINDTIFGKKLLNTNYVF